MVRRQLYNTNHNILQILLFFDVLVACYKNVVLFLSARKSSGASDIAFQHKVLGLSQISLSRKKEQTISGVHSSRKIFTCRPYRYR